MTTLDKDDARALARCVMIAQDGEACADRLAQIYRDDVTRAERLARAGDNLNGRVVAALTARLDAEAAEELGDLQNAVSVAQALAVVDVIAGAMVEIRAQEAR